MRDKQDWPLYNLWRLASAEGYSLRLEGEYIRLDPIRTQGDYGQARTFARNSVGIKAARAWLKMCDSPDTPAPQDVNHLTNT